MRDPLIDRNNAYLAARRRARDAAFGTVEGLAGAEAIVLDLARWCREVLFDTYSTATVDEGHGVSDLLAFASTQSPLEAVGRVPDDAQCRSLETAFVALMEGSENEQGNVAAWLLGCALAKGLVDELSAGKRQARHLLAGLRSLVESHDVVHCAFEESLRERLRDAPRARSAILSDLESCAGKINRSPGLGTFPIERKPFNAFIAEWCSNPSIGKLWRDREGPIPVHYHALTFIPAIVQVDRAAFLERLDGFRFPHPIRQVLQYPAILHDRDEIAAALEAAPVCSYDGRSWNGKLVALLMLKTAEAHCHERWEAMQRAEDFNRVDSEATRKTKAILSSWLEELGRVVMARPDGQFLGSQWLFMKFADERLERALRRHAGHGREHLLRQVDLIEWIALGLSGAGLTAEAISGLVDLPDSPVTEPPAPARSDSGGDDGGHPRLAALSAMSLIGGMTGRASAEDRRMLLDRLDALLVSRDPAFEDESLSDGGAHGLPASRFGRLLAGEDAPVERWRQSWELLVEQRRRAQHWSHTQDGDALAPTLFLLAAGMAGIDWLLSESNHGANADKAKRLWRGLFEGARDCWLTMPTRPLGEDVGRQVGRLFARHPRVFGYDAGEGDASESGVTDTDADYCELLARDLECLGGDDFMLAVSCLNARHNGASPAIIDKVLKRNSGYLDVILRQFERWQQLERRVRRRPEIVEGLNELRAEMARSASPPR